MNAAMLRKMPVNRKQKGSAWSVTDAVTHSGAVYRGATALDAALSAIRKDTVLRRSTVVRVRSFAGQSSHSDQTFSTSMLVARTMPELSPLQSSMLDRIATGCLISVRPDELRTLHSLYRKGLATYLDSVQSTCATPLGTEYLKLRTKGS